MSANDTFVEWLRTMRKQAGLSQQDVADYAGMRQQTIARIETGQRPLKLDEAEAIAAYFGADLDGVLAGTPMREAASDLVRTRRLLTHIHSAIAAEIARGQQ